MKRLFWRLLSNRGSIEEEKEPEVEGVTIEEEEPAAVQKEDEEAPVEKEDGSVEIDLDDSDQKAKRAFAEMRVENKRLKEELMRAQQARVSTPQYAPPAQPQQYQERPLFKGKPIPQTDDEWNQLAQTDWRLAVDMRAHERAQEIIQASSNIAKSNSILEESKKKVLDRHPELANGESEKAKIYMKIIQENPQYLTDPRGPVHAMRDMEEYMEDVLGYERSEIISARREGADKERMRLNRTALVSSAGRTAMKPGNTVVLSKDDLEFCKFNGIDPKEYALNKKRMGAKNNGGIQV